MKTAHKHVFATIVVAVLACLWGFVIYPKIAQGVAAPTGLVATPGNGEVFLEWSAPDSGQLELPPDELGGGAKGTGAIITGYRIYYSAARGDEFYIDTYSIETSYMVTHLVNGVEHSFYVTALADREESERSEVVRATPMGEEEIALMGKPVVSTTSNSAIISWATTLLGTSVVEYGPTSDFKGEVSAGAEKTTEHSIEISGLTPCAGYWFKVVSYSNESSFTESQGGEFKTTGCKGESSILTYEAGKVTTSKGGTISVVNSGRAIEVTAPANLKAGRDAIAIEAIKLEKDLVKNEISVPSSKQWIGNAYSLKAFQDEKTELNESFDSPVEVKISYLPEDIVGVNLNTLKIYHYEDGSGWRQLSNCSVDTSAMFVTCQTTSFSIFGLFGETNSSAPQTTSSSQSSGYYPAPTQTIVTNTVPPEPIPTTTKEINNNNVKFNKNLSQGIKDVEVKLLQKFLNSNGFVLSPSGPGSNGNETDYFGPLTFQALVRFQEAYADKILVPYGLTNGTGFFGPKTRELVNSMK